MSDTPRTDAEESESGFTEYACGTRIKPTDPWVQSSYMCLRNQRDLLLEQNRELVEALSAMEMWVPTHCENQVVAEARAVLAKHKEAKP